MTHYFDAVTQHYQHNWHNDPQFFFMGQGPIEKLNYDFRVLEFAPTGHRKMWTYATIGMSGLSDENPVELHLFSSVKDESIVELLHTIAFYHKNSCRLNLEHTINFGRSWQGESLCTFGFISLPYLDGPDLENLIIDDRLVKFYWLIPITRNEREFKKGRGVEALEQLFDIGFDYLDPARNSLV